MPRKIFYTDHALERMEERNIPRIKGCKVASGSYLDFVRSKCTNNPRLKKLTSSNSEYVYWFKRVGEKTNSNAYLLFYVSKYINIGTLLVITAFSADYSEYKSFWKEKSAVSA